MHETMMANGLHTTQKLSDSVSGPEPFLKSILRKICYGQK